MVTAVHEVVGRDEELERIERFLDDVARWPAALVLQGEAGIGKTTLWEHGVGAAEQRGLRVLAVAPGGAESQLAFVALADLLGDALHDIGQLPDPQRHALEVALLLVEPGEAPPDPRAIAVAALNLLVRAAADSALLLAIDDTQWLDAESANVLAFAVRRLKAERIGLLVTQRVEERDQGPPLGLSRALGERLGRMSVGPLSLGAVHRLLVSRLGLTLSRPTLGRVLDACGGNPLFALEIGAALKARGVPLDRSAPLPIPADLHELVWRRVDAVSPRARAALLAVAVTAEPKTDIVERASSSAGVDEALAAGLLVADGNRLRFAHPLLGETVHEHATPRRRRELHRRFAALLADPNERARHLALAARRADEELAAELDAAALRAHERGAPASAAELADHACRLTPKQQVETLLARIARSAGYHLAAGDTERGKALLEHVAGTRPPGPDRAGVLQRLGHVHVIFGNLATATHLFEQALTEAGDDVRLATVSEQALAFTAVGRGELESALDHARSSLKLAERLGDPGLLALALCRVAQAEFLAGSGLDRPRMERAVALEGDVGDVPMEWLPSYIYGYLATFSDDLETASELHEPLHRAAIERGDERALASLLVPITMRERAAGNWDLARHYAAEAVERGRQAGLANTLGLALGEQAFVSALVGEVETARAAAEEGLRLASETGAQQLVADHLAALGFLELSLGDAAAAHRHLGPLVEAVKATGLAEPGLVRFLPDEIEALVTLGEPVAAQELLVLLEEPARALDRVAALAAAARCRALLRAADGDFEAARASLDEALGEHARLGQPFELGRTLLVQGSVERRAKQRGVARAALERAIEIFDELGARLWSERAQTALARIGGRAPSGRELTTGEQRIAALVAAGRTNKEVAAELFVTVSTVEAALTRVYSKLGIRSRTELARRLGEPSKM